MNSNANDQGIGRRHVLLGAAQAAGFLLLAGCDNLSRSDWFKKLLGKTEGVTQQAQRLLTPRKAMARNTRKPISHKSSQPTGTAILSILSIR